MPYSFSESHLASSLEEETQQLDLTEPAGPSPFFQTLEQNEFRLLCLVAPDSLGDPVHLTLEAYNLDQCPEYETVSYTWAGEDGDGSLSRPIFIGPFWDVLLQTKNCWEMLRFMRPWRGTRMIWVDAICINQGDIPERNSQVALMSSIYSAGSRVIVYLGPEIAVPLQDDRHPRRRRLHELESGRVVPSFPGSARPPPYRLNELLRRRYFSRIWVIQELLLSQRIVMRVGDVDFWADPTMSSYFSSAVPTWSWDKSHAPWVQHVSRGASNVQSFKDLLLLSSRARATDPRDRVFGLLGIMPELAATMSSPSLERVGSRSSVVSNRRPGKLDADYSLSCQHVFIGLFAYCLFELRQTNILYHASCLQSLRIGHYPSWAPDWRSQTTWQLLFKSPKLSDDQVFEELRSMIMNDPRFVKSSSFNLYSLGGPATHVIEKTRAWHHGAQIEATSGALRINATHYMTIKSEPVMIGKIRGLHVFAFQVPKYPFTAYILSEHPLDKILTLAGNEHIFILSITDHLKMYLIVRLTSRGTYQLLSVSPFVVIQIPSIERENEIPSMRTLRLEDIQSPLYDALSWARESLDEKMPEANPGWRQTLSGLFPTARTMRDILPLLLQYHKASQQKENTLTDDLVEAYLSCIKSECLPRYENGYIIITISNRWTELWGTYIERAPLLFDDSPWEYRLAENDIHRTATHPASEAVWTSAAVSSSTLKKLMAREQWIDIRFAITEVHDVLGSKSMFFQSSDVLSKLGNLSISSLHTGESLWSMLNRSLRDADLYTGCPPEKDIERASFADLFECFGMKGSTAMISIL